MIHNDYIGEGYIQFDNEDLLLDDYNGKNEVYWKFLNERGNSVASDLKHYKLNKSSKVGDIIECAENRCKKHFKKKSYQQAFCCTKHKDQFWNRQRIKN